MPKLRIPLKLPKLRARRSVVALLLAIALGIAVAGAAWYQDQRARQPDVAIRQSLAPATSAAQASFSYDYRSFDTSVTNARAFVTGHFPDEYAQTTTALKPH